MKFSFGLRVREMEVQVQVGGSLNRLFRVFRV